MSEWLPFVVTMAIAVAGIGYVAGYSKAHRQLSPELEQARQDAARYKLLCKMYMSKQDRG